MVILRCAHRACRVLVQTWGLEENPIAECLSLILRTKRGLLRILKKIGRLITCNCSRFGRK